MGNPVKRKKEGTHHIARKLVQFAFFQTRDVVRLIGWSCLVPGAIRAVPSVFLVFTSAETWQSSWGGFPGASVPSRAS